MSCPPQKKNKAPRGLAFATLLRGDGGSRTRVRREDHPDHYVRSQSIEPRSNASDRQAVVRTTPGRSAFRPTSPDAPGACGWLSCLKSAPLRNPAGRIPGDGSPKLVKRPVRSCSLHLGFSALFIVHHGEHGTQSKPSSSPSKPGHPLTYIVRIISPIIKSLFEGMSLSENLSRRQRPRGARQRNAMASGLSWRSCPALPYGPDQTLSSSIPIRR